MNVKYDADVHVLMPVPVLPCKFITAETRVHVYSTDNTIRTTYLKPQPL